MEPLVTAFINHVLRGNAWALERLRPFAGRVLLVDAVPISLTLAVLETGELGVAPADASPSVALTLTPGLALRLLARDQEAWQMVGFSGDTGFATAINQVFSNLHWDAEEDLSRVFGDVLAHRIAQGGKGVQRWLEQSGDNLARSFAEYWTEEQPLIAHSLDVRRFNLDVDRLRDDVARLEKRLARIAGDGATTR